MKFFYRAAPLGFMINVVLGAALSLPAEDLSGTGVTLLSLTGRIASLSDTARGISGVWVGLTGDDGLSTTSGTNGEFSFIVEPGVYRLTPFSKGRLFDPSSTIIAVDTVDISGILFGATASETDDDASGWCAIVLRRRGQGLLCGLLLLLLVIIRQRGMQRLNGHHAAMHFDRRQL